MITQLPERPTLPTEPNIRHGWIVFAWMLILGGSFDPEVLRNVKAEAIRLAGPPPDKKSSKSE